MTGDVRWRGATVALKRVRGGDAGKPNPELANALVAMAAQHGLIWPSCGVRSNVIRFLVPLTAADAILDEGLGIPEHALTELTRELFAG